jgi:hypothetical protein
MAKASDAVGRAMIRQIPAHLPEHCDLACKLCDARGRFHCNNVGKPLFLGVVTGDIFKAIEPSALILRSRVSGVSKDGSERAEAS